MTVGITPVQNLQFDFRLNSSSWSPPLFSSENTPISYHIYIENEHGQLLYNDITEDTSYELYNLTVCDIYTATVITHSGKYSSSNVTIKDEYDEGIVSLMIFNHLYDFVEICIIISTKVIFNEQSNLFNIKIQIFVSKTEYTYVFYIIYIGYWLS